MNKKTLQVELICLSLNEKDENGTCPRHCTEGIKKKEKTQSISSLKISTVTLVDS